MTFDWCRVPTSVPGALDGAAGEVLRREVLRPGLERLEVGDEHPDLVRGDEAPPRRHPLGAPLRDRLEQLPRGAAEVPPPVGEARRHRAAPARAVAVDA